MVNGLFEQLKKMELKSKTMSTKREDGFVILTALLVCFLIASIVASVILITASDLKSNAKQRQAIEARFAGESYADSFFASIANLDFSANLLNGIFSDPRWFVNGVSIFANSLTGGFGGVWFKVNPDGSLSACVLPADAQIPCYRVKLERPLVAGQPGPELVLTIVVRTKCAPSATPRNCVYRQFEQRFRLREYINKVSLTGSESGGSSVGSSYSVAYLPGDQIQGNVHTNDTGFLYCRNAPNLGLSQFTSGGSVATALDVPLCQPLLAPWLDIGNLPPQFLAGQIDNSGNNLISDGGLFRDLAGPNHRFPSVAKIELLGEQYRVDGGPPRTWPVNGVIYVDGSISSLSGNYSRGLSIYATENITIDGDLIRKNERTSTLLGIATPNNILLRCDIPTDCDTDRRIDAVLNAIGTNASTGQIYNENWANSASGGTITINGSIISSWRPVFGAYTSQSQGGVTSGWQKSLIFAEDLRYNQPPYFFRTTQANVARSSINEGPCTQSFCI